MLIAARSLLGSSVHAEDDLLGSVKDALFDASWQIQYLVTDTGTLLPGRRSWVPTSAIQSVDWEARQLSVPRSDYPVEEPPESASDLHSLRQLRNYHVEASDGAVGHIDDFLVDDDRWVVRYLVVDTLNWLPGKRVLVAPKWAESIGWEQQRVRLNMQRQQVWESPPYDPLVEIDRAYETRLHAHYGQQAYWE